ncbi:MAG TPA: ester cyclase [Thermoanaerobaculia bacterium]|jgi:steroid delta-isomerase-like uncharacterized protein
MTTANSLLARRWFDEVWNERRDATVIELLDPNIVGYMEGVDVRSPEDFLKARAGLLDGFPDLQVTVDDVVSEGDNVVVRWSASGTHKGAGLGIPPSKRRVSFRGMSWIVFANGRIVKGWDSWNLGQLFSQLTAPQP